MALITWLEQTALAEWVRVSVVGYPAMITAHAVGMGVMVGLALMLNLRLLGAFASIPYSTMRRFMSLAWAGFTVNLLSGSALFAAQASMFVKQTTFLLKIGLVIVGAASVAYFQPVIRAEADRWHTDGTVRPAIRAAALGATLVWVAAIVAGRMTAYV